MMIEIEANIGIGALGRRSHVPMTTLPDWLFAPSESLSGRGWPDFSVRSLAEWSSSAKPAPDIPADCCLALCYWRMAPVVAPSPDWTFLLHETGGIWEERQRLLARRLEIGASGVAVAHSIGRAMAQSNRSAAFAELDELIEYRGLLNQFGLDCNHHIQAMSEGFYPIDLTEEAWAILDIVDDVGDLGDIDEHRLLCLAILAPNASEW